MNVQIQQVHTPQGLRWQVTLDQHVVTFAHEAEARQFFTTLQARLQAPHSLPAQEQYLVAEAH